jgi:FAD/FMN-containing dehydrogenase
MRHAGQKSSAGYDLTRLMVGGEHAGRDLEVMRQALPLPEAISAAICSFPIEAAVRYGQDHQMGIPIARVGG